MYIELSYTIGDVNPLEEGLGLPKPIVKWRAKFGDGQGRGNQVSSIEMLSHTGTHIDTAYHVLSDGAKISDYEISDFVFTDPIIIECPKGDMEEIEIGDLNKHINDLKKCDLLLIYTGFSKYRFNETERYVNKAPGFSLKSAEYIVNNFPNIRCIGMDFQGVENVIVAEKNNFSVHKILLGSNPKYLLIEDMNIAPAVGKKLKRVFVAPIRMIGTEGSPVTIIAEI